MDSPTSDRFGCSAGRTRIRVFQDECLVAFCTSLNLTITTVCIPCITSHYVRFLTERASQSHLIVASVMIPTESIRNAMLQVNWADRVALIAFGLEIVAIAICDAVSLHRTPPSHPHHHRLNVSELPQEPTPQKSVRITFAFGTKSHLVILRTPRNGA